MECPLRWASYSFENKVFQEVPGAGLLQIKDSRSACGTNRVGVREDLGLRDLNLLVQA